jgi:peptidyl-prolyl cis-trans isomerase C
MSCFRLTAALAILGLCFTSHAIAQQPKSTATVDPSTEVIAVVNGEALTKMQFDQMLQLFNPQARAMAGQNKGTFMRELVLQELLAQEGRRIKLDQDPVIQARIKVQTNSALARSVIQKYVEEKSGINDDSMRKHYNDHKGDFMAPETVTASHILVKTEDEAKAVLAELKQGKDFAELAKQKSTGPSGPKGGALGSFERGRMVPEFENVAFAMQAGDISEPVKTRFGWHVIKVTERTAGQQKSFDEARDDIRQTLVSDYIQSVLKELSDKAAVEIKDPAYQYEP